MKGFIQNIFSIGDNLLEHNALLSLYNAKYINTKKRIIYLKSIKLKSNPTYDTVINQINKLKTNLHRIHKNRKC